MPSLRSNISEISIQNFKFFPKLEKPIVIDGNNALVYGENGAGKSSIYWALYTLLECANKEDIDEIIDKMNLYAISQLITVGEKNFNGRTAVDFVGDIILKVMEGTRKWETAECSFRLFLFGCLKSDISNFFKTKKQINTDEIPEISVNGNSINIEKKRKQVSEMLKEEGADDDELTVFEYWMDGVFKPAEIGKDLGVDVKEIYVIMKRLKRKLENIEQQAINIL